MKQPLKPPKTKTAANALVVTLAAIVGIVGINVIGSRVFTRVDLTEDKIYTLSPRSREVVAALPDRLLVKAYISSGLQPPLNEWARYVRDVLDEYAAASGGKLVWEAIDPLEGTQEERNAKKEELKKYKIQPITLERMSEAKFEIGSDNYLGIGFAYGTADTESIPRVVGSEGLEYRITSIIKKLVSTKKRKVGLVTSEAELTTTQGMQLVGRILEDYEVAMVDLEKPVPDDVDALLAVGPRKPFADKAKYHIDQFLMKGKSVALFVDGMVIESPNGMNLPGQEQPKIGRGNDVAVNDLLEKYGVKVREDLILDEQNTLGPVPVGGQLFLANHPVFLGVTDKQLSRDWPVTEKMKALILPFASSVELVGDLKDSKSGDVKVAKVAESTDRSWRQTGFFLFNPQVEPQKSTEIGPFALGYALEGKFKSAFPAGPPGGAGDSSTPEGAGSLKESEPGARLLVIGDSDLFNDESFARGQIMQAVPIYNSNILFFLNTVDWLMHDESLISLRAKGMATRPVVLQADTTTKLWRWFNIVGVPALLVGFGIVLWVVRSARRRSFRL